MPGAGKSTIALPLVKIVNELLGTHQREPATIDMKQGLAIIELEHLNQTAISVSLDGWHTTRADLDKMPVGAKCMTEQRQNTYQKSVRILSKPGGAA